MAEPKLISLPGFIKQFEDQNRQQPEKPFCFVLGAGASRSSGIPTGAQLAQQWLADLHLEAIGNKLPLEAWATPENVGVPDFSLSALASFYSHLYETRFSDDPEKGYAFLENTMVGKEPSIGYAFLAAILSGTPHKVVITTNFDNLVADALSIYSKTFPLVLGDHSLARYARVHLRRPLIAKIHGALGFAMRNSAKEVGTLPLEWITPLTELFKRYSPIVIGYDGNDRGLMGLLEKLEPGDIRGLWWCAYSPSERDCHDLISRLPRPVHAVLTRHSGKVVPIDGFDELMVLLGRSLKLPDLLTGLDDRHAARVTQYKEQLGKLSTDLTQSAPLPSEKKGDTNDQLSRDLLAQAMSELAKQQKEKPWWEWDREARAKADPSETDAVYQQAIEALPRSPQLLGTYAEFLRTVRKEMEKAEEFYNLAIDAEPKNAITLGKYAYFLRTVRNDMEKAEVFYKLAIDAEPKNAIYLGNYAVFLSDFRKDMEKGEDFYKLAIAADSKNATNLGNYAAFLLTNRKDMEKAELFFKLAIDADPKNTNNLVNYGTFLSTIRRDVDHAETFFKLAIAADPENANAYGNLAHCYFQQSKMDLGLEQLAKAETLNPSESEIRSELLFYRLAHDRHAWPAKLGEMAQLLREGARSPDWPLDRHVDVAEAAGHPSPHLLRAIAGVIAHDEPLEGLSRFPEWPAAPG